MREIQIDLDVHLQQFGAGDGNIAVNSRLPDGHGDATLVAVDLNEDQVQLRAEYADMGGRAHAWLTIEREALAGLAEAVQQTDADGTGGGETEGEASDDQEVESDA